MAKKKEAYTVIPVEEKEMEERPNSTEAKQAEDELEERFDKDFWLKVKYSADESVFVVVALLLSFYKPRLTGRIRTKMIKRLMLFISGCLR